MSLKQLNKIQRAAVEATDGPILIFEGAGSGKTRVLTHKMFYLISEELYKPDNILAMTFTNKAAKEMKERVMELLDTDNLPITIGTFHSVCARLLRIEAKHLDLSPQFAIYDVQDQLDLLKVTLKKMNITKDTLAPNHARNQISYFKSKMITPSAQARKARTILEKMIVWFVPITLGSMIKRELAFTFHRPQMLKFPKRQRPLLTIVKKNMDWFGFL